MDSLPNLNFAEHPESLTPSEQALVTKLKRDLQEQLSHVLSDLRRLYETSFEATEHTHGKDLKAYYSVIEQNIDKTIPVCLSTKKTKSEISALYEIIHATERLAFLTRYFNWDNQEAYNKLISSRVPHAHGITYSFNTHLQNLVKSIIQNIDPHKNTLQDFLDYPKGPESYQFPIDYIRIKTPIMLQKNLKDPASIISLENYYLKRAYKILGEVLVNYGKEQAIAKVKKILRKLNGASGTLEGVSEGNIGSVSDRGRGIGNRPGIAELEKELEKIHHMKNDNEILEYLYQTKARFDELYSQARASIIEGKDDRRKRSPGATSFDDIEGNKQNVQYMPLEKVDEVLLGEIKGYNAYAGKGLKAYWQELSEEIRQEVVRMISLDKFLLQASYLSIYFVEKFVSFHSSGNQFASENFAKLIEDFCYSANKEYKNMPAPTNEQGVHPLYYCYVAENQQDFYLVEYHPESPILKVYMTAAPMLATLHKHLAKLDTKKIAKKSFDVTRLNFYDTEVGVELRNLYLNTKKKSDDGDDEDHVVPRNFRYFIYTIVFLLQNSPIPSNTSEVSFTVRDLITFYNYLAEFQNVSLKHQEESEPIPANFEFCYPFVDMRQPHQQYLHYKKDLSKSTTMASVRHLLNNKSLDFKDLPSQAIVENNINEEALRYLKQHADKQTFNFDGHAYIFDYVKKNTPVQTEGLINPNEAYKVISKEQTKILFETFFSGNRNGDKSVEFMNYSNASKVHFLFPGTAEYMGLLMMSYEKKKNRVNVYLWDLKDTERKPELGEFIEFLREMVKEKKDTNEEYKENIETRYILCKAKDDLIIHYFRHHYFPYTLLLDKENSSRKGALEFGLEDLIDPFKAFMSVNIAENNLDVFKVYSKILEEKMFKQWEIANIGTMWKFNEFKYTLKLLTDKLQDERVEHVLTSFNFLGAMGSKVYYCYFREISNEESKEETKEDSNSQQLTYLVDLYSLSSNLDLDDKEILGILYQCCQTSTTTRLIFNEAYHVNPFNNILLYTQVEITLSTLGYLVHFCGQSLQQAFQTVSYSVVGHYEILETLMSETADKSRLKQVESAQEAGLEAELNPLSPQRDFEKAGVKIKVYQSYFEEPQNEIQYKKKIENELPSLLQTSIFEDEHNKSEIMDISSFLNIMNCEVIAPFTFFFATNELFTKRIIANENNILTDRNVYLLLIKELISAKKKYEEALELKYKQTSIYFIIPPNLLHIHQILMVNYHVEAHKVTFYYLQPQNKPKLNDNILAFIESLSLKLAAGNTQVIKAMSSQELKVHAYPVTITEDVQNVLNNQYPLIIKTLICFSSRQDPSREDHLVLNMERLNSFICDYAEDLFIETMERSQVKAHYKYLSNLFLQKNSPITNKVALLTFLNGTASIEQLGVIQDCIRSFRDDFDKIIGIEHAFFCFNVSVKQSLKHYLLHLTRQESGKFVLQIFTNVMGDTGNVIDRMIQSYCLEEEEAPKDQSSFAEVLMFKINIPNQVFAKYLDLSGLLFAHAVCNGLKNSNEYMAQLALSPIHYFNELNEFEEKCQKLDLFRNVPTRQGNDQ